MDNITEIKFNTMEEESYLNQSFPSECNQSELYNASCYDIPTLRYSLSITVVFGTAYFLVFIMGIIGNSLVVAVVVRAARMRTVTNIFIANLAVADLLVNVFCLPVNLIGHTLNAWVLGWFVCKTVPYLQGVSVSASINTLVAISVDRSMAICYPMKWQMTSRTCRRVLVVIWIFSMTITLPWAIVFRLVPVEGSPDIQICRDLWPSAASDVFYFVVANLVMCYLLPLTVISVCYSFIWHKVWIRKLPGETNKGVANMMQRSKMKVIKMMFIVVILFTFSWLPLYAIFTRIKIGDISEAEYSVIFVATPIAQWLGTSNSCINPILYAFLNNKFRAGFKAILVSKSCCSALKFDPMSTAQYHSVVTNKRKLSENSCSAVRGSSKSLLVQVALDDQGRSLDRIVSRTSSHLSPPAMKPNGFTSTSSFHGEQHPVIL